MSASRITPDAVEAIRRELGSLLWRVEELFGENPAGTYPSDLEMTIRLAYTTAGRAVREASEVRPSEVAS